MNRLVLGVLAVALAGCGMFSAFHDYSIQGRVRLSTVSYPPLPEDCPLEVFEGPFFRDGRRLDDDGDLPAVVGRPYVALERMQLTEGSTRLETLRDLAKKLACEGGGDAVVFQGVRGPMGDRLGVYSSVLVWVLKLQ